MMAYYLGEAGLEGVDANVVLDGLELSCQQDLGLDLGEKLSLGELLQLGNLCKLPDRSESLPYGDGPNLN